VGVCGAELAKFVAVAKAVAKKMLGGGYDLPAQNARSAHFGLRQALPAIWQALN
jgi:hypothetical protein